MHSTLSTPLARLLAVMLVGLVIAIGGNALGHILGLALVLVTALLVWRMSHREEGSVSAARNEPVIGGDEIIQTAEAR